jgi:hypothetical protein
MAKVLVEWATDSCRFAGADVLPTRITSGLDDKTLSALAADNSNSENRWMRQATLDSASQGRGATYMAVIDTFLKEESLGIDALDKCCVGKGAGRTLDFSRAARAMAEANELDAFEAHLARNQEYIAWAYTNAAREIGIEYPPVDDDTGLRFLPEGGMVLELTEKHRSVPYVIFKSLKQMPGLPVIAPKSIGITKTRVSITDSADYDAYTNEIKARALREFAGDHPILADRIEPFLRVGAVEPAESLATDYCSMVGMDGGPEDGRPLFAELKLMTNMFNATLPEDHFVAVPPPARSFQEMLASLEDFPELDGKPPQSESPWDRKMRNEARRVLRAPEEVYEQYRAEMATELSLAREAHEIGALQAKQAPVQDSTSVRGRTL